MKTILAIIFLSTSVWSYGSARNSPEGKREKDKGIFVTPHIHETTVKKPVKK